MAFFEKHGLDQTETFRVFQLDNFDFSQHFHRAHELIYINKGQISVVIDQKEYTLREKDAVFIFTNQMHEFKTIESSDITVYLFSPELIGDFSYSYKGLIPVNNFLHIDWLPSDIHMDSVYRIKSFLYALCAEIIKNSSFVAVKQSPQMMVLYQMLLFVEQNYENECTLKTVAKHLRYDYQYLSKIFSDFMDMTFTDYLNHYRIYHACYLLRNCNHSMEDISVKCGYNTIRTFHRNFQKVTGQSPTQYRILEGHKENYV